VRRQRVTLSGTQHKWQRQANVRIARTKAENKVRTGTTKSPHWYRHPGRSNRSFDRRKR
jgi:hypothetical protein